MWLFHRKGSTKRVEGGESFVQECPTCQRETRFEEIEISSKYGVWFVVDIIGDSEKAFRCTRCGDTFDVKDPDGEKPATRSAASAPDRTAEQKRQEQIDRVEQLAAEQRRRDAEAAKHRANVETRIDDELAELKKRMGR